MIVSDSGTGGGDGTLVIALICPAVAPFSYAGGAVVRNTDASNYWKINIELDGSSPAYIQIIERASGVNTIRATTNFVSDPTTNATVTLTIVLSGTNINVTADTAETCNYASASSNQTATKHGLFGFTNAGYAAVAVYDFDFTKSAPPPATTGAATMLMLL